MAKANEGARDVTGTIVFGGGLGRSEYAFDVFELSLPSNFPDSSNGGCGGTWSGPSHEPQHEPQHEPSSWPSPEPRRPKKGPGPPLPLPEPDFGRLPFPKADREVRPSQLMLSETRLTDGISVNSNGHLVEHEDEIPDVLYFVTERDGYLRLATVELPKATVDNPKEEKKDGEKWEQYNSCNFQLLQLVLNTPPQHSNGCDNIPAQDKNRNAEDTSISHLENRPQVQGSRLVFVSTQKKFFSSSRSSDRQSWTAVYSVDISQTYRDLKGTRLTPEGVSDYSPALSPSGKWVIAASLANKDWNGEIEALPTDLYVFDAIRGSRRKLVTKNGGWPSWSDDKTVYFHRVAEDGWWSVFRVTLPDDFLESTNTDRCWKMKVERVTPPGLHAFTPSASRTGKWIAVATRRPFSKYPHFRHVEAFDLRSETFIKLTEIISPEFNYYNPSVSHSKDRIVYHRCRGNDGSIVPRLEALKSPITGLAILRVDGTYPALSHHDKPLLAYSPGGRFTGLAVTGLKYDSKQQILFGDQAFSPAWDWQRKNVVYFASGRVFARAFDTVDIYSIDTSDGDKKPKQLTKYSHNNAFPSPSPDGKKVVFRSGRNGFKNLYIMDAVDGELFSNAVQLTNGDWTDTMPNWSPTGEWIAFSSNRGEDNPLHFSGYLISPKGLGLRKVFSDGGLITHMWFSPDGKSLVFASDLAGVSSEPISIPDQPRPYGDIFVCDIEGCEVTRMTHNPYDNGTPCWGSLFIEKSDLNPKAGRPVDCDFDDVHWLDNAPYEKSSASTKAKPQGQAQFSCCPFSRNSN